MADNLRFQYVTKPVFGFNIVSDKFKLILKAPEDFQILNGRNDMRSAIFQIFNDITAKLNSPETRHVGVLLLDTFLPQCYDEIFARNGITWMRYCIQIVADRKELDAIPVAFKVLSSLFELSNKFSMLRKSNDIVRYFLENVHVKEHDPIHFLQCLKPLVMYYPEKCQNFGKDYLINELVYIIIHKNDSLAAFYAGQCLCYLGQVRVGKTEQGEKDGGDTTPPLRDVLYLMERLCGTANKLLFSLFTNLDQLELPDCVSGIPHGFDLKKIKQKKRKKQNDEEEEKEDDKLDDDIDDLLLSFRHIAIRFVNVLSAMEGMLMADSKVCKRINVPHLMGVAFRTLSVNCSSMLDDEGTVEHFSRVALIPRLHVAVFNFLRCFVTCYDGLLGYGSLLCQLVVSTLQWTESPFEAGNQRPFGSVRRAAYLFLEAWAVRAKSGSCVELHAEKLLHLLLPDVTQKTRKVTLQDAGTTDPLRKERLLDPQANAEVCAAALRALCAVVEASGTLLMMQHHVMLQEAVVGLLLAVRRNSLEYLPFPFSSPQCRLQLYRLLLALTVHPHGNWPAPLQFALTLFPYGQHDPSLEVSSFCLLATATARQMVHPSRANAQFPISVEDFRVSVGLEENPRSSERKRKIQTPDTSRATKKKKETPVSDVLVNGLEKEVDEDVAQKNKNTHVLSSGKKVLKKKKQTPVSDVHVNGLEDDFDNNIAQENENTSVLSSGKKALKNSSPATKKKKPTPVSEAFVYGLEEEEVDFTVVPKKKPKRSLEASRESVTQSFLDQLLDTPRFSESSEGSLDLSTSRNKQRLSMDNWEVVELPQKEKKKKKRRKQEKQQLVDEEPLNRRREKETRSIKVPLSNSESWNVSDCPSNRVSPKKIPVPSAETVSSAQRKSTGSLGKGENSRNEVPVVRQGQPLDDNEQDKCIVTKGKQVGQVRRANTEPMRGKGEVTGTKTKDETQVRHLEEVTPNQKPPSEVTSTSRSSTPEVSPVDDHSSKHENGNPLCYEEKLTESKVLSPVKSTKMSPVKETKASPVKDNKGSPVKDTNTTSESAMNGTSDVKGTAKEKFQGDKPMTSASDSRTTSESLINIDGDKEPTLDCGEKLQEDEPSSPVKQSKSVSEDNGTISGTVTIEEIPTQDVGSVEEKLKDTSAAKDSSSAHTPIVDLADSDNSCSVISLDSDDNEKKLEGVMSEKKESAANASFEDSQDPDASTGMDAVEASPRISLEGTEMETTAVSRTSEKESEVGKDSKNGSETDEEEILTTFVDIVSTDS